MSNQNLQNARVDLLSVRSLDFKGRQIKNAGDAKDKQDYVTLGQVNKILLDFKGSSLKQNNSGEFGDLIPIADNTYQIGRVDRRWTAIYVGSVNLSTTSSLVGSFLNLDDANATVAAQNTGGGLQVVLTVAGGTSKINIDGTTVVKARITGFGAVTGGVSKSAFDTTTVTLPNLAQRVGALWQALGSAGHGLLNAT